MDRLFLRLSPALTCFERGWGGAGAWAERTLGEVAEEAPVPIEPRWSRAVERRGVMVREGRYPSPAPGLPVDARRGRVRWLAPSRRRPEAVCVALAAWNDETFAFREGLFAPLVRRGLAVMMLENPLYGSRRLPGRRRGTPETVEEFLQLGFGTVQEARGLLAGLRRAGVAHVGVAGFSMGGHMAALTAASVSFPVTVVAMAPSCTPSSVFLDGMLAAGTRAERLGEDGPRRLRTLLDRFAVSELPPPIARERCRLVGTRRDGIVPSSEPRRIAEHWGVPVTWLDTGHVGAAVRHRRALRGALADAFLRGGESPRAAPR